MDFEYDQRKSGINRRKQGIDFAKAREMWNDPDLLEIPARTTDEPRSLAVGRIRGRHWAAVFTYRSDRIRIISVRRARTEEVKLYESKGI